MSSWRTEPLGNRTINLDRRRIPVRSRDRKAGPYPYYGASGVVDHIDNYIFDGLHLLVAEDGENLRSRKTPIAFLVTGQFWVNNHAHIIVANDDNDTRYLAYALESADVSGYITGSTQPKLTQAALAAVPITAPDATEQRAIAAVLGALDDKIESNQRAISLAGQLLDATSEKWAALVPSVPLADLVDAQRATLSPARLGDQVVDHYSLPAFDEKGWPDHVPASSIMSNKLIVARPSILVSRLNPRFNRTWWAVPNVEVTALASTEFSCLEAVSRTELAGVWLAVRDADFRSELVQRVTGTSGSHQRIRPDDMLTIKVPDTRRLSEHDKNYALNLLDLIHVRRRENVKLSALRDALLPELLSGRIRVRQRQRAVEEIVA
jgi:type I restriction enzyme S subunit